MKLFDKLKGLNPTASAVKGAVEGVSGIVDRFIQTPDEKAAFKAELEKEISSRWARDMQSDSWLSKNVRPLVLIWCVVVFTILMFTDGNIGGFVVQAAWIPMFQSVLLSVIGAYFVVRTIDKRGKVK